MKLSDIEIDQMGKQMYELMEKLYPICRSITGNGVRQTLNILTEIIPIEILEVPSGTKVFDWTIPREWNIRDAYVKNSRGERIIDFNKSNLHVLNYSISVNKKLSLAELKEHLYTLPDYPENIPYLTSYYKENWGFCITQNQFDLLEEDTYEVAIDSSLENGFLTYGELYLKGDVEEEFLFSTYLCHPSLCNDNLSGVVLLTYLAQHLMGLKHKYSYRFLFIPETIGSITWLFLNENKVQNIKFGLVATCLGDKGDSTYKKSRRGNAEIDRAVEKVLIDSGKPFKINEFFPSGSDERQYSSPGFNLPVGSLMRTPYSEFIEYHTSADNLDIIKPEYLSDTYSKYLNVVRIVENDCSYLNLNPKCEPQLGKRGLYNMVGSQKKSDHFITAICWVLNLSDGFNSLLDISIKSKMNFDIILDAAEALKKVELLKLLD